MYTLQYLYINSLDLSVSLTECNEPDESAQGMMGGPHQPKQRTQDMQGRLTVSEGHGYPLNGIGNRLILRLVFITLVN
jgi:hypothetical protein